MDDRRDQLKFLILIESMRTSHLKAKVPTQMKPSMPVALDDFWPHDKVLSIQLSLLSIFYLKQ